MLASDPHLLELTGAGLHNEFLESRGSLKLNGKFISDSVYGMLETKAYQCIHMLFPYIS